MLQRIKRNQRLFLIDGMAIAYRSYFAFINRPLINSKGENTSAIYGFVTFLNKILEDEDPDYIAVVFDTPEPTFRHKEYPEYKATREKMPEDMSLQLDTLKEVVRAYRIPVVEIHGFEADDVMATLSTMAEKESVDSFLVTSDKDFMQLVTERTKIYKPGRQGTDVEIVGPEEVVKKFGVQPDKVIDVLGLIGDKSDNVPGVAGIGEKTAAPLIQEFGSIEKLLENIEKVPQKGIRNKLTVNKENAILSKRLVTLDTRVPLDFDFHTLKAKEKDVPTLAQMFDALEFKALRRRLLGESAATAPAESDQQVQADQARTEFSTILTDSHDYVVADTIQKVDDLCARLSSSQQIAVDTETTSTDPFSAELVGISVCAEEGKGTFIPVKPFPEGLNPADVLKRLKPILEDPAIRKIGQNLKYDITVLHQAGIDVEGTEFDTMLASYLINSDGQHSLDALAREYLNYSMVSYDDLTGTGRERMTITDVPLRALSDYACEDADITYRLARILRGRLEEAGMWDLYSLLELPLMPVLARMEANGVAIDVKYLEGMSKEFERMLDELTRNIYRHAGEEFNINSTQQLGQVLFTTLRLPPVRKTKTGYSTDVAVLEQLRSEHPIVEQLLEYRQLAKLKSTYVDALPQLLDAKTKRIHASFNQTVASTGRLSSSNPNLQNIPIRTDIGRSIRSAFVSRGKGWSILAADYSQIELRVMAHISGDEGMRNAFLNREDIHTTTAAKVFGVDPGDVNRDMRRKAKEVNFGIMYGIGPFGLARRLEISQAEARAIIDRYFDRFPKVNQYIQDTISFARTRGYVETLRGRRRYLPDIKSRNHNVRQNAERQAINMPIQGTAADMIKLAMIAIDREIRDRELDSLMILQVHDELVFEIREEEESLMRELVTSRMTDALVLDVPVEVDIGVADNWLNTKA